MNLELTDEQQALRETVRRLLAQTAGDPAKAWAGLVELGAVGVLVPEAYGGAGLTMVEAGIVAEELGRALLRAPWLATAVAAPRALDRLGVARDKAAGLLAGIAAGSTIATVALFDHGEPARVDRRGADLVLTGEKEDVPDAGTATVLLALAEDDVGPGLFEVDVATSGVELIPQPGLDATRELFQVSFDAAPARRLATAPATAVQALVDDLFAAWAADALGAAESLVELAVAYAKVRTQFGRPIGSFQAVQHLCVDMHATVELARGGVLHALWAADAPRVRGEERHLAAVRAKAFAGQLAAAGDTAIQVFGGIGFTWEHDAHRHLRRLLDWSAFRGPPGPYLQELGAHLASTASTASTQGDDHG